MSLGKIIYAYDALCGWCYPGADVMKKAIEKYEDRFDFEILSGGLVLGERAGKIGEKLGYINDAFKKVESHTAAKFGPRFLTELKKGDLEMNSLPPSKALTAFKEINPASAFDYAHSLQNALYFDGKSLSNLDLLADLAENNGADKSKFIDIFNSDNCLRTTQEEFEFVSKLGINGFPTILFERDEQFYLIARGYQHFLDLNNVFKKIIDSFEKKEVEK